MKAILSKCKKNIYVQYTILFIILSIISYFSFIKLGKSFIWKTDGLKQHYVILYDFNRIIRNIFKSGIPMFSWNMGLGLDIIGQYSYYILGEPFAYLSLLFPMKGLKYAYQFLIILRVYCVGIAFIIYSKYNKKENMATLIGAIIYTFCGYIIFASVRHPYFTNPAIMLPLVLLGIDKILKENKYIFFTITIALLAIMNYYFLYMITILAFIYAIIKYIVEYRQNGIKDFFRKFIKTALCYIIGVMIAGIILLPTAYAFLNSNRMGAGYTFYDLKYYEKLIFGQPDTPYWSKSYVSAIILLMLPVSVINLKKNKENKTYLINIIISIIILLIPFLGSVMNGFSFQSNRWVFGYCFYVAYLVTLNLRKDVKYSIKEILAMIITLMIYMIIALIATDINQKFALISIFSSALMITIIYIRNIFLKKEKYIVYCRAGMVLLVGINIIIYAAAVYDTSGGKYVNQFIKMSKVEKVYNSYENNIKKFNKSIKYVKSNDKSTYRVGTNVYKSNNMPIKSNYKGLNTYLSIGNKYISNLSKELMILNCTKTDMLNELDSRTKITTLLGCKYYITPINEESYIPYGYKLIKSYKNSQVYENQNYIGIGAFYDNYILRNDYESLSPLEKEQALLDTAVLNETPQNDKINYNNELTKEIKKDTIKELGYKVISSNKNNIELQIDKVKDCELYVYIENLECDSIEKYKVKIYYEDIIKKQNVRNKVNDAYYEETPNILFNLGYKDIHNGNIYIQFEGQGNFKYDNIKVLAVPMDNYRQSIKKIKESNFEIEECKNNLIKGKISNDKNGILQIATSYSKGWKAYVDGKKTDIINVNTGFIGIELNEGEHEIYFKYCTPYIKIGAIISILGIIILITMIIKVKRK